MSQKKDKKVIGILRGGIWGNYEKSLSDGGKIISYIFENLSDKWKPVDILIDKNEKWHFRGLPIIPAQLTDKVDIIWNTAHPNYSKNLSDLSIPNIETHSFSKISESKEILREHMKKIGIDMPRSFVVPVYQEDFDGPLEKYAIKKAKEIFKKFSSPWIVKPLTEDLNTGIHITKTFPELVDAIEDCVKHKKSILVEEFIYGKNASAHSVAGFRGENIYSFPPVENKNGIIFSPGKFTSKEKEKLTKLAKKIHTYLGAAQYLKSNFILHSHGIYLSRIEFSPNLNEGSCFYKSCESVGTKARNVIEHILERILT